MRRVNWERESSVSKIETYRQKLQSLEAWDEFLLAESNLPGLRANLELAFAAASVGAEEVLLRYARLGPEVAARNTPEEFLAVCGVGGRRYEVDLKSPGSGLSLFRFNGFNVQNAEGGVV